MEVVSTNHKQTNNLTNPIICFEATDIFSIVYVKAIVIFDFFLFRKFTFFNLLIQGTVVHAWKTSSFSHLIYDVYINLKKIGLKLQLT